jgi:hypothetical protein
MAPVGSGARSGVDTTPTTLFTRSPDADRTRVESSSWKENTSILRYSAIREVLYLRTLEFQGDKDEEDEALTIHAARSDGAAHDHGGEEEQGDL